MKKIIGILRPFDYEQSFFVYEEGNKIDSAYPLVDEINDTIFDFIEKYDIHQMDLAGPKQYTKGIENKYREAEMTKYSTNIMEINII